MSGLWQILGYDEVASGIADDISQSGRPSLLEGPPGVGKSWLAKGIGALWQQGGGSTVVAEGDWALSDCDLFPFGLALSDLPSGWDSYTPVVSSIARIAEAILGTRGRITDTIEGIVSAERGSRTNSPILFEEPEQEILHRLERLGRGEPILLIADNLHWWDDKSLRLLAILLDSRLEVPFPFLRGFRVLCVQTTEPYQQVANPSRHAKTVSAVVNRRELGRIQPEVFAEVLTAVGLTRTIGPKAVDAIHAFTGGHLALARKAAAHINRRGPDSLLNAAHASEFVMHLVDKRVSKLGELGVDAVGLLQVAALLGLVFRREELLCASPLDTGETIELLQYINDEDVLQTTGEVCRFVHDYFREHYFRAGESVHGRHHRKLADCLRILRPADYSARALNALGAGLDANGRALTVQASLAEVRAGRDWRAMPDRLVELASTDDTAEAIGALVRAYELLGGYRHEECLAQLERVPHGLGKAVQAETDYARSMCLLATRNEADRERARQLLSGWEGLASEEPELGARMLRLLVYGLSHLGDKNPGRELEANLQRMLSERSGYDESALDELHVLDRCSGSLHLPDVSLIRYRRAVKFFAPPAGQSLPRRPVEYYRCLSNLTAKLISNGLYEEAAEFADLLDDLVARYGEISFPRPDFARMNTNLARYRAGLLSAEAAATVQEELSDRLRSASDPYYASNALVVFRVLSGNSHGASDQLAALHEMLLRTRAEPEPSMSYLLQANGVAIDYVTGADPGRCLKRWNALEPVLAAIPYMIKQMLQRRHELLGQLMASGRPVSPVEFDEHPPRVAPDEYGPMWDNFGRGFRLPEVEFWRDN